MYINIYSDDHGFPDIHGWILLPYGCFHFLILFVVSGMAIFCIYCSPIPLPVIRRWLLAMRNCEVLWPTHFGG